MIFVTVGTHEQPFNRLVEYMDKLKGNGEITEDVIIQTGFSTYKPRHCKWSKLFSYPDMIKYVDEARIVITHGGPSSFIMPLQIGKIPVVVPRQKKFDEHVNNHQLEFCERVSQAQGNIIVVEDINELGEIIKNYESIAASMPSVLNSNNAKFCENFGRIVDQLMKEK